MDAKEFLKTSNLPKNWSGEDEEYGQWLFYEKNVIEAMEQYHQSKVNNVVLDGVSNCCVNCDEAIINEPYCESCYDLANSRDNT